MSKRVFACIGTRADIIKMSPILSELKKDKSITLFTCLSGQHREMAYAAIKDLGVKVDQSFEIMTESQRPSSVLGKAIVNFTNEMVSFSPNIVLVHGDTTTALAGALAAAYLRIPVFYVEAGLRTYSDIPFPEELHRRIITHCSTFFSCQDGSCVHNLQSERIKNNRVFLTGSTLADVLFSTIKNAYEFQDYVLKRLSFEYLKKVVVTLHRNELKETDLINICKSIARIAEMSDDIIYIWPVHPNPRIHNIVFGILQSCKNVLLLSPLSVRDMHNLLFRCSLVLTDSAGLQEEAYLLGKPTIVLRNNTERLEFLDKSNSSLISPSDKNIYEKIEIMLNCIESETDFILPDRLYTKTGASLKICSAIRNILSGDII